MGVTLPKTLKKIKMYYSQQLKMDEIDFRYFIERNTQEFPHQCTPLDKTNALDNKPSGQLSSQKILNFDNVEVNFRSKGKVESIELTNFNFDKMKVSPYVSKMVRASPFTKAMELYNWLQDLISAKKWTFEQQFEVIPRQSPLRNFIDNLKQDQLRVLFEDTLNTCLNKVIYREFCNNGREREFSDESLQQILDDNDL